MKEKMLMIEILESRLNTANSYIQHQIESIKKLSDKTCEIMFDDFLTSTFVISEARDFWRNKLQNIN